MTPLAILSRNLLCRVTLLAAVRARAFCVAAREWGVLGFRYRLLLGAVLVGLLILSACEIKDKRVTGWHVSEEDIGEAYYFPMNWIVVSPDSLRVAYVEWKGGNHWQVAVRGIENKSFDHWGDCSPYFNSADGIICFDGREKEPVVTWTGGGHVRTEDDLPRAYLLFSPNSNRIAFFSPMGDGYAVTVDGRADHKFSRVWFNTFEFGADSRHFHYFAQRKSQQYLVFDHQEYELPKGFDFSEYHSLVISPEGRFAYRYQTGKAAWLVNNSERRQYDEVKLLTFSKKRGRFAYAAKRKNGWSVVCDDHESNVYDDIEEIAFSPGGSQIAFSARRGLASLVVLNGAEGKAWDLVKPLFFSPDDKHLAFGAKKAENRLIVVDEREIRPFATPGHVRRDAWEVYEGLVFSPDSKKIAYVASNNMKQRVAVEDVEASGDPGLGKRLRSWLSGTQFREYDEVDHRSLMFSPVGKVSYRASFKKGADWKYVVVVNGKEYEAGWPANKEEVAFSPDGRRFAFFSINGSINIDGIETGNYGGFAGLGPVFSADGAHIAFVAQQRQEFGGKWLVVVDGMESQGYDSVYVHSGGNLSFGRDFTVQFVARREAQLFLGKFMLQPNVQY